MFGFWASDENKPTCGLRGLALHLELTACSCCQGNLSSAPRLVTGCLFLFCLFVCLFFCRQHGAWTGDWGLYTAIGFSDLHWSAADLLGPRLWDQSADDLTRRCTATNATCHTQWMERINPLHGNITRWTSNCTIRAMKLHVYTESCSLTCWLPFSSLETCNWSTV